MKKTTKISTLLARIEKQEAEEKKIEKKILNSVDSIVKSANTFRYDPETTDGTDAIDNIIKKLNIIRLSFDKLDTQQNDNEESGIFNKLIEKITELLELLKVFISPTPK